jgi:hypothetical protein
MRAGCGLRGLDLLDAAIGQAEASPATLTQNERRCRSGAADAATEELARERQAAVLRDLQRRERDHAAEQARADRGATS